MQKHPFKKYLVLFLLSLNACQSLGQGSLKKTTEQAIQKTLADNFSNFRESAPIYWGELKNFSQDPILNYLGLGVGDAHILNFNFIETSGTSLRHIQIVDFDDNYSQTSLFGDWLRFFIGADLFNQEVRGSFNSQSLWQAYLDGLGNKNYVRPTWIVDLEKLSTSEYAKKQTKYLKKFHANNQFTAKAEVFEINEQTPKNILELYNSNKQTIEKELSGLSILDFGYYLKSGGGSKDQVRFWYLVQDKSQNISIKEFKHLNLSPSPVYAINGLPQTLEQRSKDLNASLSLALEKQSPRLSLKFTQSPTDIFLMRDKAVKLIDCDPEENLSPDEVKSCNELLNYQSYLLGKIHSSSNKSYSEAILKSPTQYETLTEDLNKKIQN